MGDLLSAAQLMRDRVARTANQYKIPQVRTLVLGFTNEFGEWSYEEVKPSPITEERYAERDSTQGLPSLGSVSKRFEVKGVSRSYSRRKLEQETSLYYLDAIVDEFGQKIGGIECELVEIDETPTLHWNLVLTRKIGQQGFYS